MKVQTSKHWDSAWTVFNDVRALVSSGATLPTDPTATVKLYGFVRSLTVSHPWFEIRYYTGFMIQTVFVVNKLNRRNFWKKRIKSLCGQCQGLWCRGGAFIEISLEMSSTTQWLNMCSEGIMADETRQWHWGWGGGECTPSQRQRL